MYLCSTHRTSRSRAVSPLRGGWGLLRGGACRRTWGNRLNGWSSRDPWDPQCGCRRAEEPPPWLPADFDLQPATPLRGDHWRTPLHSDSLTYSAQQSPSHPPARHLKGQLGHVCQTMKTSRFFSTTAFRLWIHTCAGWVWYIVFINRYVTLGTGLGTMAFFYLLLHYGVSYKNKTACCHCMSDVCGDHYQLLQGLQHHPQKSAVRFLSPHISIQSENNTRIFKIYNIMRYLSTLSIMQKSDCLDSTVEQLSEVSQRQFFSRRP